MSRRSARWPFAVAAPVLLLSCGVSVTEPRIQACTPDLAFRASEGYSGQLFDAHRHLDLSGIGPLLRCRSQEQNIATTLTFVRMDPQDPAQTEKRMRDELGGPAHFLPFFHVDPKTPADMSRPELEAVYSGRDGIFAGIGEIGLYRDPWRGTSLASPPWPDVFAFAQANDLWLMIHVRPDQGDELRSMLAEWPGVRVLMHGSELLADWPQLLRDFPNLHLSIDAIALAIPVGDSSAGGLMASSGSSAAFVSAYDAQRDAMLDQALTRWLPVIEAAPDRVMWGTDAFFDWHFEPQAFQRIVDISRRFIARLPAEYREPYAHGNAHRLFGSGRPL